MDQRYAPYYGPDDDQFPERPDRPGMQREMRALMASNQALLAKVAALEVKVEALETNRGALADRVGDLEAQFAPTPYAAVAEVGGETADEATPTHGRAASFATTSYTFEDRLASLEGFKSVWQVLLDYLYNLFGKCNAFDAYERWYWKQGKKLPKSAAGSASWESSIMVEDEA